jgi:tellurite resistance protein
VSFFKKMFGAATKAVNNYSGDTVFLHAAASAAANVTMADGSADDSETEKALRGLMANAILGGSFSPSQIEEAYNAALVRARTRAGRMENKRFIEAIISRPVEQRQDVLLIGADIADDGGIGDDEQKVLEDIGKSLNLQNTAQLLAA